MAWIRWKGVVMLISCSWGLWHWFVVFSDSCGENPFELLISEHTCPAGWAKGAWDARGCNRECGTCPFSLSWPYPCHGTVWWLCSATCRIRMWFTHVKSWMSIIFHRLSRGRFSPRYLMLSPPSVVLPKAELLNELGKFLGIFRTAFEFVYSSFLLESIWL